MIQQAFFLQCINCDEFKPLDDFPLRSNSTITRENSCRYCKSAARKKCIRKEEKRARLSQKNKQVMDIWASVNARQ
jgi:hypothetical protein